jgi:hypothetical protein
MDRSPANAKQPLPLPSVPDAVTRTIDIEAIYIDSLGDKDVEVQIPADSPLFPGDEVILSWTGEGSFDTHTETKVFNLEDPLIFSVNAERYVRPYVKRTVTLYYTCVFLSGAGERVESPPLTLSVLEGSGPGNG